MKVLFINHYFDQDMDELINYRNSDHTFKWISPNYFAQEVRKYLPEEVFSGLTSYYKKELDYSRKRLEKSLEDLLYDLYLLFPFDLLISPSDTFFYIRPLVFACHKIGVPFFVVQKETTISPGTMERHAFDIGKYYPFISDHMTVCSERHKQFWIKAGTDSRFITVTGQPRFDLYFRKNKDDVIKELSISIDRSKKTILFFTYELDAYLEITKEFGNWGSLRNQTEDVLSVLAKKNEYNILIKPHPQHNIEDIKKYKLRISELAGSEGLKSIIFLERSLDARKLIIASDIVVAFQTTALLEALACGKKVIYTFWGETANASKLFIIPFHKYSKLMACVHSPKELSDAIESCRSDQTVKDNEARIGLFSQYLGPFDGNSTSRTWQVIDRIMKNSSFEREQCVTYRNILLAKKDSKLHIEVYKCTFMILINAFILKVFHLFRVNKNTGIVMSYYNKLKKRRLEILSALNKKEYANLELIGKVEDIYVNRIFRMICPKNN